MVRLFDANIGASRDLFVILKNENAYILRGKLSVNYSKETVIMLENS